MNKKQIVYVVVCEYVNTRYINNHSYEKPKFKTFDTLEKAQKYLKEKFEIAKNELREYYSEEDIVISGETSYFAQVTDYGLYDWWKGEIHPTEVN